MEKKLKSKKMRREKTITKKVKKKTNSTRVFWPYGIGLFALLLFIDQYTKYFIRSSYTLGLSVKAMPGLWFSYVQNTGATWGLFQDSNTIFIWLSIIAFGFLLYFYDSFSTTTEKICYVLLLAGLWGNLIDRVSYGFVIDFIDFGWWPVFNIADSCISIGIIVFLLHQWKKE